MAAGNLVWYAIQPCDYWTDDFSKLKVVGPGIPCCPHCGAVGFQCDTQEWHQGAKDYDKDGHSGYYDELIAKKESCHGRRI